MKKILYILLVGIIAVSAHKATALTYEVHQGDWLSRIAQRLGVLVSDITGYRSGNPDLIYPYEILTIKGVEEDAPLLGAQQAVGGKVYYLSGSGVSSSQATISLTSFQIAGGTQKIVMTDFGTLGCGTIEPGNSTRQEFVSFTGVTQNADGTATLSGVSRGLSPISPYAASTTLQYAHSGGSQFVLSNSPPCFYQNYASLSLNETVSGLWTFTTTPYGSTPTSTSQFATKGYADALANTGAATSTLTNGGLVELGTATEAATGYDGGLDKPTVLTTSIASSSRVANTPTVVVTDATDGYISDTFIVSGSFGDGSDGNVTVTSATTTLTRDMYYNDLTVTSGIMTNGHRIFVKGTLSGTGLIASNSGANGSNGSNSVGIVAGEGGAGGATTTGAYFVNTGGLAGADGTDVSPWTGYNSTTTALFPVLGSAGAQGGSGGLGDGSTAGGTAGTNTVSTTTKFGFISFLTTMAVDFGTNSALSYLFPAGISSGGGGGGGGGGGNGQGGGGGGGGASGGMVYIAAKTLTGTLRIASYGGDGGNGGNGGNGGSAGGGGGGGAGGNGGGVIIIYGTQSWTPTYYLKGGKGGTGGTKGTGAGTATNGVAGSNGNDGVYYVIDKDKLF